MGEIAVGDLVALALLQDHGPAVGQLGVQLAVEHQQDMSQDTPTPPNRRRILGSTTLGAAAGLITGLAAGVALALPAKSPPVPAQPGRRRFDGKVVAITGATSGIGRAAALAFAAEGGKVAFCGRRTALGHASRPGRSRA